MLALALGGLFSSPALADPVYTITDLGTLDSRSFGFSFGQAINDAGQATGYSSTTAGPDHAFLYQGGVMTDLGTLGGNFSNASGINNSRQISGSSTISSGSSHAFLFSNGTMIDLGTLGTFNRFAISLATAINNNGQVAGYSTTSTSAAHAFLYDPTTQMLTDLGTLSGDAKSRAFAINDQGQVVGFSSDVSDVIEHAFLYTPGSGIQSLGISGIATGINNNGQIVGNSSSGDGPFLISDGQAYNLSTLILDNPGYALTGVDGINDNGQIIGSAFVNGENHAVLLTPVVQTVPEPSTLTLLGLGALGLLSRGLKRKRV